MVVTTITVELEVIGGGVAQQQLGNVAVVKGGGALDKPYINRPSPDGWKWEFSAEDSNKYIV